MDYLQGAIPDSDFQALLAHQDQQMAQSADAWVAMTNEERSAVAEIIETLKVNDDTTVRRVGVLASLAMRQLFIAATERQRR